MRVTHKEFLYNVIGSAAVVTKPFKIPESGLTLLSSLAQAYTRAVIHSMTVEYRPLVGTSKDGLVAIAIDWDSSDAAPTDSKLRVMQPQIRGAVWQPGKIVLPVARLQYQKNLEMSKDTIFSFQIQSPPDTKTTYGEIIVHYDITMMGPSGN